ncbi:Protein of unknown function [Gryllus bimaculatus]|nr:Protein of unknown function [Gryllus bimaculatus]
MFMSSNSAVLFERSRGLDRVRPPPAALLGARRRCVMVLWCFGGVFVSIACSRRWVLFGLHARRALARCFYRSPLVLGVVRVGALRTGGARGLIALCVFLDNACRRWLMLCLLDLGSVLCERGLVGAGSVLGVVGARGLRAAPTGAVGVGGVVLDGAARGRRGLVVQGSALRPRRARLGGQGGLGGMLVRVEWIVAGACGAGVGASGQQARRGGGRRLAAVACLASGWGVGVRLLRASKVLVL